MSEIEDKIDQYIAENFGNEIEQKLSNVSIDSLIMLSLYWTGAVGFVLMLVFGGLLIRDSKKLKNPQVKAIVIENISKSENNSYALFYPKVSYEVNGKKYEKTLNRGWGSPWNHGETMILEYFEEFPDTAESELFPGLRTQISQEQTVLTISFILFLFPFFLYRMIRWNARSRMKMRLMSEYRENARLMMRD